MSTVTEIKRAIRGLPSKDRSKLTAWLVEHDSDEWDQQMSRDAAAGRLDFLVEEANVARESGRLREWPKRSR